MVYEKSHCIKRDGSEGQEHHYSKAYELLIGKYPNASVEHAPGRWGIDVKVVVTIEEVKIGIESRGDPGSGLPHSLEEFVKVGCSIIICATRSSGATVTAVRKLESVHGYEVKWFEHRISRC